MTDVEQPPQNGIDLSTEDDDNSKARPADIEQDMREMERRKRVEAIMGSKLFREELERIVDTAREGGASGILQQLSDMVGMPTSRIGNVFKASNCMMPINDIRGVESMGYAKGEKILRCKLAATFRLLDLYGWTQGLGAQITARLKVDQEVFLVNPYGLLYHEITASSLNKVDMQGQVVEQGTTNFGVNKNHFVLHSIVHAARPDIRCAIYIGCSPVVAVSSLKTGLLPITKDSCVLGEISTHPYTGSLLDTDERDKLVRNLGPNSKVMLLSNHGALCCGETIEEAFFAACHIVQACETQLKLLPVGVDNLVLIPEESRKTIYEQSRRPPEDLEKKFAAALANTENNQTAAEGEDVKDGVAKVGAHPKWRVGGAEFEALMRMLDNAGYRTGYIYRHPLVKSELPKPKNDVELPPAVSSLGYLLEEEELYRQGIWKKGDLRKGGDRSRWLNSPNVYQKVEVLETGTPDPKKITKWVAEGSPTHSTPVRIEDPLQFVPAGTNPREFKRVQQQIKDNRRADKISAGPQSQILDGVTWDEANRIKDATVSSAGDHVVLMGAASKGIIQRGFQHNATVYKAPYAKNPFDNVTDDELNEYKRTVERKKKSIHGEYTDTDFSESEALSSLHASAGPTLMKHTAAAVSQSEPEDASEHQVMRIETQQAPVPSQPEVVLSDANETPLYLKRSSLLSSPSSLSLSLSPTLANEKSYKNHLNSLKIPKFNRETLTSAIKFAMFYRKYAFLYEKPSSSYSPQLPSSSPSTLSPSFRYNSCETHVFIIHKIEVFPHFTYPLTENSLDHHHHNTEHSENHLEQSPTTPPATPTSPPYRTVSHYGFNYPLHYLPSIVLYPPHLLSAVELHRQKVIEFINSTAMSFAADASIDHDDDEKVEPVVKTESLSELKLSKDDTNGSYISVKEIQLEPRRRLRHHSKSSKMSSGSSQHVVSVEDDDHEHDEPEHDPHDAISEQFSSLLSMTGSYPAVSNHSHVGEDHDHDEDESTSSMAATRSATNASGGHASENLYRSYILRNFLPITPHHHQQQRSRSFNDIQQKPESEQALHLDYKTSIDNHPTTPHKHVTLTVNSLKRRSLRLDEDEQAQQHQKRTQERRERVRSDQNLFHERERERGRANRPRHHHVAVSEAASSSTADSRTSLKSIEIHVNVVIKNSDYMKSLQTHEHEFKTKLVKVIDDEINIISQQLAEQHKKSNTTTTTVEISSRDAGHLHNHPRRGGGRVSHASGNLANFDSFTETTVDLDENREAGGDGGRGRGGFHSPVPAGAAELKYSDTVLLLEHELENLLNSIIRANELHNRAIMCDCKTKITQISEDIRASLNGHPI